MVFKNIKFEQKRTPPTNLDLQSNDDKIRDTITIILVFFIIYCIIIYLLKWPLHTFLSGHQVFTYPPGSIYAGYIKSEYTIGEQLSKFYLFIIVLVSVFSYRVVNKPTKIKLSISFLLLSLIMYMSESNMLTEKTQPIFGLIGVAFIGFFLLRLRSWLSLILFIVGITLISCGSLNDFASENESIRSLLPTFIFRILHITTEERFDVMGIAFICLSAILCFRVPLRHFIAKNTKGSLLILLSSGIMTTGNGFLHYQYEPIKRLYLIALAMTIVGFLGLVLVNKNINKAYPSLMLVTEDVFYLFIFFFFVVLPSIHGKARSSTALLLWLPSMIFIAIYLWRCHSVHHTGVDGTETE